MSFIVAIDGPSGTGKGTIAKRIAKKFDLVNIDTGATYRCVALETLNRKIDVEDAQGIKKILDEIKIDMKNEDGKLKVFLNDEDVTGKIRTSEVDSIVGQVSKIKEVRLKLVELQRKLAQGKNVIMEGRDITTYVFPNAGVKIYLDASSEERANRRYKQNIEKGISCTYEEVLKNIELRDKIDMEREMGALKKAPDATVIDTTKMKINQVEKEISKIIKAKQKSIKMAEEIYRIRPETKWKKFVRKIVKGFLKSLYYIFYRIKITGSVPETGPYIICANHLNYLDAAAIVLMNERKVHFVGKEDLFRFGILRWLAHLFDIIPIKRNMQDMEAMKRCIKVVKNGDLLGIFPEGTRKGLEKNGKAKNGASYMAIKTGTPIIPVGISGTFKPFSKIHINYGEPIDLSSYKGADKEKQDEATKLVMDTIVMLTKKEN